MMSGRLVMGKGTRAAEGVGGWGEGSETRVKESKTPPMIPLRREGQRVSQVKRRRKGVWDFILYVSISSSFFEDCLVIHMTGNDNCSLALLSNPPLPLPIPLVRLLTASLYFSSSLYSFSHRL